MTKLAIPGCPRASDVQDINRVLRQPIFEPLSDVLIARLVMLLRELDRFLGSVRQFGCERK
jgi:hypothetical protein